GWRGKGGGWAAWTRATVGLCGGRGPGWRPGGSRGARDARPARPRRLFRGSLVRRLGVTSGPEVGHSDAIVERLVRLGRHAVGYLPEDHFGELRRSRRSIGCCSVPSG